MLLILSTIYERYTEQVEARLDLEHIFYYRLNFDTESLKDTYLTYYPDDIEITQGNRRLSLSEIKVVWLKRMRLNPTHKEEQEYGGFNDEINFSLWKNEWNYAIRQIIWYLENRNVKWIDSPGSLSQSNIKRRQLDLAKKAGFNTPRTIISNDISSIRNFMTGNQESIIKLSAQPAFYIENDNYFIYTNKITIADLDDFGSFLNAPSIFQEYIDKQFEVRYTFVNGKHFVCKIESQTSEISKVDWRKYDIKQTPYTKINPPPDIQQKVAGFMKSMHLNYGALDFIVDHHNNWWFLEINSVGQYGWIEQLTGLEITSAIVSLIKEKLKEQHPG